MRSTKGELVRKGVLMPVKHNVSLLNLPDVEESLSVPSFLYVSDSPLVSMEVPLRTAYKEPYLILHLVSTETKNLQQLNQCNECVQETFMKWYISRCRKPIEHMRVVIIANVGLGAVVPTRRRNMSHSSCHNRIDLLKDTFGDRLISRFGPVNWPPRPYALTPLDYFLWGYVKSLVYADKPQTLDHLEDNIRHFIADIRPQMLEKVIENWTSRLDYIRASRGSPMPEIIFKM
ncbi:putative LOC100569746 [Trichonephila clavipes]|uniref:Putative LOC100569746 n=1 Tax=Trichonephila clavipes TaxID=2585209 RepID=A0A8X6R744_TRICX|nr:putative LOC100569746 [Trichonephila clavipes]